MSQFGNPDSFKAYGDQTTPTSSGTVQWQCIFAMEDHQLARQFFHPRLSIGTPPIIFSMVTWDHSVGASSLRGVPPRSSITELVPSLNGYRPRFLGACIREVNESWLKKKKTSVYRPMSGKQLGNTDIQAPICSKKIFAFFCKSAGVGGGKADRLTSIKFCFIAWTSV